MVNGFTALLEGTQARLINPEVVGEIVVDQIVSCRGSQLIIPKEHSLGAGMRAWPIWLQEFVRDQSFKKAASTFVCATK